MAAAMLVPMRLRLRLKREVREFIDWRLSAVETAVLERLGLCCNATRSEVNFDVDDADDGLLMQLHRELHGGTGVNPALRSAIMRLRFAPTISKAKGVTFETKGKEIVKKRRREEEEEEERREKKKRKNGECEQRKRRQLEEMNRAIAIEMNHERTPEGEETINRHRENERLALKKVEEKAGVDVVDNYKVMKDFCMLLNS